MKKVLLLVAILSSLFSFSQENDNKEINVKVSKVAFEVNSPEELESKDWEDVKKVFSKNTENEKIEMSFTLSYPESKYKIKSSIKVGGESRNIDSLILKSKKGIQSIIKLSTPYKN
ncbi:hypothetical protein [Polaribacter sp. Asnod6-C07]|uniref:hypothetical protein n=1 Tax=Polaribacter sp. Asnod6-C07 TaxID=3160582 RepID=UPI0038708D61